MSSKTNGVIGNCPNDNGKGVILTVDYSFGGIPVLATPSFKDLEESKEFDRTVFRINPTWEYFIRRVYPVEYIPYQIACPVGSECLVLVHNTSRFARGKFLFVRKIGAEFGTHDAALLEQGKHFIRQTAVPFVAIIEKNKGLA